MTEQIPQIRKVTLRDIHEAFRQYFEISDDDLQVLDVILAVYVEQKFIGEPIWLYIVVPSGGMKTSIVKVLESVNRSVCLNNLTPKTLTSSMKTSKKSNETFGEKALKMLHEKVWLFRDFTALISKNEFDRKEIYATLRDLSDGKISFASGVVEGIKDVICRTTIIAGITEIIDRQGYNMQLLGERFLKIRLNIDTQKATSKALLECGNEARNIDSIAFLVKSFIEDFEENYDIMDETDIKQQILSSKWRDKIENLAMFVAKLRRYCYHDRYGETSEPLDEVPTRIAKQLFKLGILLTLIRGKTEFGFEEWKTLVRLAEDCIIPIRVKILKLFMDNKFKELRMRDFTEFLGIDRHNMRARLTELEAMSVLKGIMQNEYDSYPVAWKVYSDIIDLMSVIYGFEKTTEQSKLGDD